MMRRTMSRLIAVVGLVGVAGLLAAPAFSGDAKKEDKLARAVRKLQTPPKTFPTVRGLESPGVLLLPSQEKLDKTLDEQTAAALAKQVNFDKESVVVVSYETAGPPFGMPAAATRGKGKEQYLEIYIQEPEIKAGEARGQALKLGLEFFAVPKDVPVKFGGLR